MLILCTPPSPTPLCVPPYSPAVSLVITVSVKPRPMQGPFERAQGAPPLVKHLFPCSPVFVPLFPRAGPVLDGAQSSALTHSDTQGVHTGWACLTLRRVTVKETRRSTGRAGVRRLGARRLGTSTWRGLSGEGWQVLPAPSLTLGFQMPQMWLHN